MAVEQVAAVLATTLFQAQSSTTRIETAVTTVFLEESQAFDGGAIAGIVVAVIVATFLVMAACAVFSFLSYVYASKNKR